MVRLGISCPHLFCFSLGRSAVLWLITYSVGIVKAGCYSGRWFLSLYLYICVYIYTLKVFKNYYLIPYVFSSWEEMPITYFCNTRLCNPCCLCINNTSYDDLCITWNTNSNTLVMEEKNNQSCWKIKKRTYKLITCMFFFCLLNNYFIIIIIHNYL